MRPLYTIVLTAFFMLSLCASTAFAQMAEPALDIIPASSLPDGSPYANDGGETTHGPLRLTPDKSELVRLDAKAASIIVGNPTHVNVLAESAQTLVFVPRQPGATYVTVLNQMGEVVMARHVIVASPQKKYVRIRKSCNGEVKNCQSTQVYYCPDMCHEIALSEGGEDGGAVPDAGGLAGQSAAAGGNDDPLDTEAQEE